LFLNKIVLLVLFTVLGSSLIAKTTMHQRIATFSAGRNIPGAQQFYNTAQKLPRDMRIGKIIEVTDKNNFIIETRLSEQVTVVISPETKMRDIEIIKEDNHIVVIGKSENGVVVAKGIRLADDRFMKKKAPNNSLQRIKLK
jgi:23S rRNA-/tRNA-specific pseudouridylate synthase